MANKDQPMGFVEYGPVLRARLYDINAAATMFINDLLNMESDGYPDQAAAADTCIIGAVQHYRTASSAAGQIIVYDHPQQLFVAQADGSDLASQTYVGNNTEITVGTGSSTTGLSAMELDSSEATAGAAQIHMLKRAKDTEIGANAWGANVRMICSINEHMYNSGAGTGYV